MTEGPFGSAAFNYRRLGWQGTIKIPYMKKAQPPEGYTGYGGDYPDDATVLDWALGGHHNIALRMPDIVLGLDGDEYGEKTGVSVTLREAEERLGELPPTWRSSSRGAASPSGIRFYRVPGGRRWAGELGPSVELIHHGHRYAVVWPSVHPDTKVEYQWYDPKGRPCGPPRTDELPELPEASVKELDRGPVGEGPEKVGVSSAEVDEWLEMLPEGGPCRAVRGRLEQAERQFGEGGSRHETARNHSMALVGLGDQGHVGVRAALDTLEGMFLESLNGERRDDREFRRMVEGAVARVKARPTLDAEKRCCSTAAEDFGTEDESVFASTPVLAQIRQAARSRILGAEALLCYMLARVLAELPPGVSLPATVGAQAALNLGIAVVGKSGAGKSALLAVSRELLGFVGATQRDIERSIGSGEGLAETFLYDETERGPHGGLRKTGRKLLIPDPRRIITVDEVDQLAAIGSRSGATLGPTLRSALTGGALGQENASSDRRRHVPERSYRLVLLLGVQPTRSDPLLSDADAGTPQRLVWVRATDPDIPDQEPEWPGQLDWELPALPADEIDYPEHIREEVRAARRAQVRHDGDPLEGHRLLTQLKVATGLALLHGEVAITDQWWGIAAEIVGRSMQVQAECRSAVAQALAEKRRHMGRLDAIRQEAASAYLDERAEAAARAIWGLVHSHATRSEERERRHAQSDGCTARCISRALRHFGGASGPVRDEALEIAEAADWIEDRRGRWFCGGSQPAND